HRRRDPHGRLASATASECEHARRARSFGENARPGGPPPPPSPQDRPVLLMIDNYDSFTFNLVQYLQVLGAEVEVVRNDALTVDDIARRAPSHIVISPGPCTPNEAGVSIEVIERLGPTTPVLGVC